MVPLALTGGPHPWQLPRVAASGWHTHLAILTEHLSGREPPPFWSTHAGATPRADDTNRPKD